MKVLPPYGAAKKRLPRFGPWLACLALAGSILPATVASASTQSLSRGSRGVTRETSPKSAAASLLQLTDPGPYPGWDEFGYSVAVSQDGSIAVVGAPFTPAPATSPEAGMGAVYVYQQLGGAWDLVATLVDPSVNGTSGGFGYSVALSSDDTTAFVADNSPSAVVFVFYEPPGGWSGNVAAVATLAPGPSDTPNPGDGQNALSITDSGSIVCLGLFGNYNEPTEPGAAYVWVEPPTGWASSTGTPSTELVPSDGFPGFGYASAISSDGTTIAIGAYPWSTDAPGAVYIYKDPTAKWLQPATPWAETQRIQATTSENQNDGFGDALSFSSNGSVLAVGSPLGSFNDVGFAGDVYIFTESSGTWVPQARLVAPDAASTNTNGWSVSLSSDGTTLVTGAPSAGYAVLFGAAYVYSANGDGTWSLDTEILPPNPYCGENFGWSVQLSGDDSSAVIGAPGIYAPNGACTAGTAGVVLPRATSVAPKPGAAFSTRVVPRPYLAGFSPRSVAIGGLVTITGSRLTGASVTLNGLSLPVVSSSSSAIEVRIPPAAHPGRLVIDTSAGSTRSATPLRIEAPAPVIIGLTPKTVDPGGTVRIRGAHLAFAWVYVGKVECKVLSYTTSSVVFQVAPSAVSGFVTVQGAGGTAQSVSKLKVLKPSVSRLSPTSGAVGTTVEILGNALDGVTKVLFHGGASAKIVSVSNSKVVVIVPSGADSGRLSIRAPQGTATSPSFTVT